MLIGGHVSPAGGLAKAVARGVERECRAIQIFNQSPRAWRPTNYTDDDFAAFREAMADSPIDAVVIHAVYLINCATEDREMRDKSRASLVHALRVGAGIGALGVVLHAGSALKGDVPAAISRAGALLREALADTEGCALHIENTAGAGGTLGRSFGELAALLEAAGGNGRLGICLDSCHLLASGYDIRTAAALGEAIEQFDADVGCERLASLHCNDSLTPLGTGELGDRGCAAFLSEPRFEGLPCLFEGPGFEGRGAELADIQAAWKLRKKGLAARKRGATPSRARRTPRRTPRSRD